MGGSGGDLDANGGYRENFVDWDGLGVTSAPEQTEFLVPMQLGDDFREFEGTGEGGFT